MAMPTMVQLPSVKGQRSAEDIILFIDRVDIRDALLDGSGGCDLISDQTLREVYL